MNTFPPRLEAIYIIIYVLLFQQFPNFLPCCFYLHKSKAFHVYVRRVEYLCCGPLTA